MSSTLLFTERQENIRSDATVYAFPTSRSWRTGLSALSPVNKGSTTDDTAIYSSVATMQSFLHSFTNSFWSKKTTTTSTNNGERSMDVGLVSMDVVSVENMGDDELAVDTDMNEVNDDELADDNDTSEVNDDKLAADNDTSEVSDNELAADNDTSVDDQE